ncbi:DNA repair protein RecN [Thiomicrorhabdus aquaedulcis]|uniref:DNA repair protein RecN n=1 Tax=Thiomicrorhabdus aquaedulcis TaxID=2211106 RepID=UPI000FD915A6|nr:DNA repair protein RecN [Thiomicrorhabdus aquaedulcis]
MLQELTIQNLALIEHLTLNFNRGFSTLTGETGAGKSILLDALGLALGERADSALVRHHTERADVTALFDVSQLPFVQAWLTEQALDDADHQCYLRRIVTSEGRSKAFINGRPIPASSLKTLGSFLIDIHGQHEHQSLLQTQKQLTLLDAYAQHPEALAATRAHYKQWQALKQQLDTLLTEQADYQSKLELLQFQLNEFDEVAPQKDEFMALSEEQGQLSHASEIISACQRAYDALEGENSDNSASEQLNAAIAALESIAAFTPTLANTLVALNSALIETQEAAGEIQHQFQSVDIDPQQLQRVEERLAQLFALAKKYHLNPEELVEKHHSIQHALQTLTQSDSSIETLKNNIDQAWSHYQTHATQLSQSRQKAALKLAKIVTQGMQQLGMPNGLFELDLSVLNPGNATGFDKVEFKVTANIGQPLQPLAKVASGGELSRISLAIQVATAEVASLPTLIFDEVDVGIGGGVAEVVGHKMRQLGAHKQILSITHLAQVASHGHTHLHISKTTQNQQTFTQVVELDSLGRTQELARMMGGLTITEQTLNHAQEMLVSAQQK